MRDDGLHTPTRPSTGSAEADAEQPDRGEAGGDQATPAGDLDRGCWASASSAGSSVIDASSVTNTVAAAAMPMPGDERQPDQQHAEQRDDDGDAGEHDGAAGGVHRGFDRRVLGLRRRRG